MAQMDGGAGRKNGLEFIHHVFHEAERFRAPHADGIPAFFPLHGKIHAVANQIPVGMHGRIGMAGKVYFRNNGNLAAARIGNNLLHLLLGVKTAVGSFRVMLLDGEFHFLPVPFSVSERNAPGAHGGKQWIFFNFQAPAGTVRQVQVEAVKLEQGHGVNHALDFRHGKEVAGNIQHQAPPFKAGNIPEGKNGYGKPLPGPVGA